MAKVRQVRLLVSDEAGKWFESYREGETGLTADSNAELWGLDLVEKYNAKLRPGEKLRTFLEVAADEIVDVEEEPEADEDDDDDEEEQEEQEEDGDDKGEWE